MAAHYIFVFHLRHSEPQIPLLVTRSNTEHKEAHQQNVFCRKCPTPSAENATRAASRFSVAIFNYTLFSGRKCFACVQNLFGSNVAT
jgi:hypothetical protein